MIFLLDFFDLNGLVSFPGIQSYECISAGKKKLYWKSKNWTFKFYLHIGQGFDYILLTVTSCHASNLDDFIEVFTELTTSCDVCNDFQYLECGFQGSYSVYVNYQQRGTFLQLIESRLDFRPDDVLVLKYISYK